MPVHQTRTMVNLISLKSICALVLKSAFDCRINFYTKYFYRWCIAYEIYCHSNFKYDRFWEFGNKQVEYFQLIRIILIRLRYVLHLRLTLAFPFNLLKWIFSIPFRLWFPFAYFPCHLCIGKLKCSLNVTKQLHCKLPGTYFRSSLSLKFIEFQFIKINYVRNWAYIHVYTWETNI